MSTKPDLVSKEPCHMSNEPYLLSKEPCHMSIEPDLVSKEPCHMSNKPCLQPCLLSKEPCIMTSIPALRQNGIDTEYDFVNHGVYVTLTKNSQNAFSQLTATHSLNSSATHCNMVTWISASQQNGINRKYDSVSRGVYVTLTSPATLPKPPLRLNLIHPYIVFQCLVYDCVYMYFFCVYMYFFFPQTAAAPELDTPVHRFPVLGIWLCIHVFFFVCIFIFIFPKPPLRLNLIHPYIVLQCLVYDCVYDRTCV